MIGKTISHYKILEKLGEGGMGVVYKAEDSKLDRIVALKFLTPQAVGEAEEKARFVREAKTAAALNHPHICTIHEIDDAEGTTFIAMECIEGQSLKDKIESGPLKLDEAVGLAIQVAEGLHEAHQKGVVHRDIKPSNIMITHGGQAKIMDFGLAKSLGGTALTKTGKTLGTVAYMSPEQGRGEEVDARTDIWSLGVMLYELVTGQKPFKGDYEPALVYSILNEAPEPVTGVRTGVPIELEGVISRCLEKDRDERYQTAGDLLADLRRVSRRTSEPTTRGSKELPPHAVSRSHRGLFIGVGVIVVAAAAFAMIRHFMPSEGVSTDDRKMLVVLPFENLGAPEDEYFADGITEEITSRLASVRQLGVISRTSAVQYADTDKTIRQIGDELGVEFVLEGSIRWARDPSGQGRVRITPQLIRVDDDTHLWAETYDRVIEDIFAVQTDIAQKVVERMGVTLLEADRPAVDRPPTDNLQAYHAYLRGKYYAGIPHFTLENWKRVIENYQQAVEIDPNFALAHAELSKAHARLFYFRHDLSDERKRLAKTAIDRAVELAPESPEVRLAVGIYYFWVEKELERAHESFELAAKESPEIAEVLDAQAELFRHQGRWQEAVDHYQRACELSPRHPDHFVELAMTNWWLRRYPEAVALCDDAIALAPDQTWPYLTKVFNYWSWNAALDDTRSALEKVREGGDWVSYSWYWQRMFEGEYQEAIEGLHLAHEDWIKLKIGTWPRSLLVAYAQELLGEEQLARANYEMARSDLEKAVLSTPNDPRCHSSLGIASAALGERERAIREGKLAVELYPISMDAVYGLPYRIDLAHIYTILGEHDAALEELDELLSIPGWISVVWIETDPRWNALRENPGYRDLLDKYSGPQP
jgi:non-specific serine/threonine protein kinase